jgi:hypothetical protein
LKQKVYGFLQDQSPQAYTAKEIAREFGMMPDEQSFSIGLRSILGALGKMYRGYNNLQNFVTVLDELVEEARIERRVVSETDDRGREKERTYYRVK